MYIHALQGSVYFSGKIKDVPEYLDETKIKWIMTNCVADPQDEKLEKQISVMHIVVESEPILEVLSKQSHTIHRYEDEIEYLKGLLKK